MEELAAGREIAELPLDLGQLVQVLLTLLDILGVVELLEVDEFHNVVLLCETFDEFRFMLEHAPDGIVGDANVERTADMAGENVDVVAAWLQRWPLGYWVARS